MSIVCIPHFCWGRGRGGGGGVELPTKFSKEGLGKSSTFTGGLLEKRGGDFVQGGLQFLHKNKLKSEIFNNFTLS